MANNIAELKQRSGIQRYASLFGKSVIDSGSSEYAAIKEITRYLIAQGWGVIHGGYVGGAMSAVSEVANELIKEKNLSPYLHIAVPQADHDNYWTRVEEAMFTNPAEDIFERLRMITTSDIAMILPKGGMGTQLELTTVFHENQIKEYLKRPVQPLIFYSTPTGTNWRAIIDAILTNLDMTEQSVGNNWLYFVDSIEELGHVVDSLQNIDYAD